MTTGRGFDAVPSALRSAAAVAVCLLAVAAAVWVVVHILIGVPFALPLTLLTFIAASVLAAGDLAPFTRPRVPGA